MDPNENDVVLKGTLNHVLDGRAAMRSVILEKSRESGLVYLNVYRIKGDLKKSYELTADNFIGTERGSIKTNAKRSTLYWAIILKQESILFNDKESLEKSASDFERWNKVVKELWNHQSWEVCPVQGPGMEHHTKLVLHLNSSSLCLAQLSPPRHLQRWPLACISQCDSQDCLFIFNVIGDHAPGHYEMKVTRSRHASKIKSVCDELKQLSNGGPPVPAIRHPRSISMEDSIESAHETLSRHRLALHQRNSNGSIGSTQSGNLEKDSVSIASVDSIVSTPSPTLQKRESPVPPSRNPFVFPLCKIDSNESSITDTTISHMDKLGMPVPKPRTPSPMSHGLDQLGRPVAKPRTPSPSSPYHVACVDPHSHTTHVTPCVISTYYDAHPPRPPSPTIQSQNSEERSPSSTPRRLSPLHKANVEEINPYTMPTSIHTAEDRRITWSSMPNRANEDRYEESESKPKLEQSKEATYINTLENDDNMNPEMGPLSPERNYENLPEDIHYQNPGIRKESGKDEPEAPPPPPRKRELHELIEQARIGKCVVKDFLPSISSFKQFCLHFDIKKDTPIVKDWRALAERLCLKRADMDLIEHTSCKYGKCTSTEIVLAYWQSNEPDDLPFTQVQLIQELRKIERYDLIEIIQPGNEHG